MSLVSADVDLSDGKTGDRLHARLDGVLHGLGQRKDALAELGDDIAFDRDGAVFDRRQADAAGQRLHAEHLGDVGADAAGQAALTQAQILKSSAFPEVDKIVFDEFIPENGYRYISADEPTQFLGICESIFRDRERTKVLFLANNISLTNPYFSSLG